MTQTAIAELSLNDETPAPDTGTESGTLPIPALEPGSNHSRPAVRRCLAAWRRVYKSYIEASGDGHYSSYEAKQDARLAYSNAMPLLSGHESIRDFIACAAHGILIGAFSPQQSGQILYAAQVALGALQREKKPRKPA